MNDSKKLILVIFLVCAVLVIGVIGYSILLNTSFIDALYMTVITISTVGYGEVAEMTDTAKVFSILLIFSGLAVFGYGITSFISLFFEGKLKDAWRKKRMNSKMKDLRDHYIVCGAGDVGSTVIKFLKSGGASFVVIEENERKSEELVQDGILTITGDATLDETLQKAGINHAKGIICTLPDDAENVFTVLTARQMNDDIYIVSKAVESSAHSKLRKAGADKTISPNEIGGQRIAAHILRPAVVSFLDVITRAGDLTLDLQEVVIAPNSSMVGKRLFEAKIPDTTGLMILALKSRGETTFRFNPNSNEILNVGDTMVVLGTDEQVNLLRGIVNT